MVDLSSVIKDGNWFWPPTMDIAIGGRDILVWKSKGGVYSCSETWNCLRTKFLEVPWCHVI
jgi:hypothetical protein